MKKVTAIHKKNTDGFTSTQGDDDFVNEWVARQVSSNAFGFPQREVIEDQLTADQIKTALSSTSKVTLPERIEIVAAVKDKDGKIITPERSVTIPPVVKKFYLMPAEYQINIEEFVPSYSSLRLKEYREKLDPFFNEAVMEKEIGLPEKMNMIVKLREEIKLKYPKPK